MLSAAIVIRSLKSYYNGRLKQHKSGFKEWDLNKIAVQTSLS